MNAPPPSSAIELVESGVPSGNLNEMTMAKTSKSKIPQPSKIFTVEDHPTFREGLAQIVNGEKDLTVCGHAGTATEALQKITRLKPDLVLVDITLPGKSGFEMIKELRATNDTVKILVLSMHDEALYATRVLRAGGNGYIMKQEDPEDIIDAIRDVLAGHIYVSERVLDRLPGSGRGQLSQGQAGPFDQLTDAEVEILELLGRGESEEKIARQLHLSPATVVRQCAQMRKKLRLKGANALVRYAVCWIENGSV
jgi:DNA-binding NarL/FixJ family response regulator